MLLSEALKANTTVSSLIMLGCRLTSDALHHITMMLKENSSIKLLDIRYNKGVDVPAIVQLIQSTKLEVVDVRWCGIKDEADGREVARALCTSNTIHTLGFGEICGDSAADAFLTELCEFYPPTGPLHTLIMFNYEDSIKVRGSQLAHRLHTPNLMQKDVSEMGPANDAGYKS